MGGRKAGLKMHQALLEGTCICNVGRGDGLIINAGSAIHARDPLL